MPDNQNINLNELIESFKKKPGTIWVLLGLMGLGLVLIWSGNGETPSKTKTGEENQIIQSQTSVSDIEGSDIFLAEKRLENEIREALQNIAGAGEVYVDVNLRTGHRKIWERQNQTNKRVTQQREEINTEESSRDELVLAKERDGQDAPVLKEEIAPEIQGIVVIASGAGNPVIRQLLTETVMTLLNLPAHRVFVTAGKP